MLLEVKNVKKDYQSRRGGQVVRALSDVTLSVRKGEFVSIMGESGSGKTTLLNIISTLDRPSAGEVTISGRSLAEIDESEISQFRRDQLGFVFQDFNLMDNFTAKDNILLPLVLARRSVTEMEAALTPIATRLGIGELLNKYPYELSGGQQQRTAAARALITHPELLLADEPTGALDSASSAELLKLFEEVNASGQTIIMVTHSARAASHSDRVLFIRDGRVFHEIYKGEQSNDQFMERISESLILSSAGGGSHVD